MSTEAKLLQTIRTNHGTIELHHTRYEGDEAISLEQGVPFATDIVLVPLDNLDDLIEALRAVKRIYRPDPLDGEFVGQGQFDIGGNT